MENNSTAHNSNNYFPYVGIIRIRYAKPSMGRTLQSSSQPVPQAPLFISIVIISFFYKKVKSWKRKLEKN